MAIECGIVGLPNVGKSTLFNCLTSAQVAAENFPFCTVDPNRGIVPVPDPRLDVLQGIMKSEKVVPALTNFVDIAGLVKGASTGEGLGNQFLSHIREVHAIAHVVRCFEDPNVIHVMGGVDPKRDIEIIQTELCLADLDHVEKRIVRVEKLAKTNKDAAKELEDLKRVQELLSKGLPIRRLISELSEDVDWSSFLTGKPLLYVANIAESDVKEMDAATKARVLEVEAIAKAEGSGVVVLSAALEFQLGQLSGEDKALFFAEYGITESGLSRFIQGAFDLLGLHNYFTVGPKEVRSWPLKKGSTAVDAAGVIHSDFAKGFIRAEVIHFADYVACGGEKVAREKGLQRAEGKEYIVQNGDVILFRFNV